MIELNEIVRQRSDSAFSVSIKASDAMAGQTSHIELSTLSNKR